MPNFIAFSLISFALVWAGILATAITAGAWLFGARPVHIRTAGLASVVLWSAGALVPLLA